ncbi:MAG: iron-containing alcohol dehydrogenase [Spirochaetales bacterium]|nr:iron-containing alcohol dehydrogenase [Spirochaetales bacterium]
MSDLLFSIPHETIFGVDIINRLGNVIARYGERVLVVTEAILYERQTIERVIELLEKKNISYIIYDEVVPNATSSTVEEALLLARGSHAEVIIGMGGIRALSIAKCVAMAAKCKNDFDDFLSGAKPENEPLAYIEIPTTCRNPFMHTDEYLVVDARDRSGKLGKTQPNITKSILIDPKLSLSLPSKYTATTMIDTFLSAFEGIISTRNNFFSDTLFYKAIEMLIQNIDLALKNPEDIKLRIQSSAAGMITALGLSMSKQGIGSALAYALNSKLMVPKSWLATILFPSIIEFSVNTSSEKIVPIAKMLGEDIEGASSIDASKKAVEALRRLIGTLQLPTRLRDFDLNLDDMVDIAKAARSFDMMNYLSRMASDEELFEIIKQAY